MSGGQGCCGFRKSIVFYIAVCVGLLLLVSAKTFGSFRRSEEDVTKLTKSSIVSAGVDGSRSRTKFTSSYGSYYGKKLPSADQVKQDFMTEEGILQKGGGFGSKTAAKQQERGQLGRLGDDGGNGQLQQQGANSRQSLGNFGQQAGFGQAPRGSYGSTLRRPTTTAPYGFNSVNRNSNGFNNNNNAAAASSQQGNTINSSPFGRISTSNSNTNTYNSNGGSRLTATGISGTSANSRTGAITASSSGDPVKTTFTGYTDDPFGGQTFYDGSGVQVTKGKYDKWIVVTSIQEPTSDIKQLANLPEWKLVVVGDTKSPKDFKVPNAVFLSYDQQKKFKIKMVDYIPTKSYSRKNIGYFFAYGMGAKLIYDTDDDNHPNDGFRSFSLDDGPTSSVLIVKYHNKTFNPYPHFGQQTIWPRGYPVEEVSNDVPREYQLCEINTPYLRQGIVNGDPDVDAIYRLLRKHPTKRINLLFDVHSPRIGLPPKTFAPYNSQNTIHSYDGFWGMAHPVTFNLRVLDIWRSYFTQRLMWLIGGHIGFYTAGTFQFRTAHSYHKDFVDEKQLYYDAGKITKVLNNWQCSSTDFLECANSLATELVNKGFWVEKDKKFYEAWYSDLKAVGYKFPPIQPITETKCKNTPTNVIYYAQEQKATYGEVADYYLPPWVRAKFDKLATFIKYSCPRSQNTIPGLMMNGSSLINDIVLIIHLENIPSSEQLNKLEAFYRPRFGQILYCGKWDESKKQVFHDMRASFAEIRADATDPEMACVYKAADMHYIVEGYLVINQNTMLNVAQIAKKSKISFWAPETWVSAGGSMQCGFKQCPTTQFNLEKAQLTLKSIGNPVDISSCALNKAGTTFSFNPARVFYVPAKFDLALRRASSQSLDPASLSAWMQCVEKSSVTLKGVMELKDANQATDFVQKFDFSDMTKLCPVLGYNP